MMRINNNLYKFKSYLSEHVDREANTASVVDYHQRLQRERSSTTHPFRSEKDKREICNRQTPNRDWWTTEQKPVLRPWICLANAEWL